MVQTATTAAAPPAGGVQASSGAAAGAAGGAPLGLGTGPAPGSDLPELPPGAGPLQLMRAFQATQAARAHHYSVFGMGFKRLLETRQEGPFRAIMTRITQEFNACSHKVIAIEAVLKEAPVSRPDLAQLLRRVQTLEREKLNLTLTIQSLKQAEALQGFSWQRKAAVEASGPGGRMGALDADEDPLEPQGSGAHRHGHGHGHACCGCGHSAEAEQAQAPEPTQEEFQAAMDEALQAMDKCVRGINEVLEEVQYAVQELQEDGN